MSEERPRSLGLWAFGVGGLAMLLCASPAAASSGVVTGYIKYYEHQGNFCPTSRDCAGALYLERDYHTYRPIIRTRVSIVDSAGSVIGAGQTDQASGKFVIAWASPNSSVQAGIQWYAEDVDGRFRVQSGEGRRWVFWTQPQSLVHGTTTPAPQNMGTRVWGTPAAPHPITNVYAGAQQTWWWSLTFSSRMLAHYYGIRIRAFNDACANGCYADKQIDLDEDSAYTPQARVMHEMGHAASGISHKGEDLRLLAEYCWPNPGSGCGYTLETPEWGAVQFEEAMATVFGSIGLYTPSAVAPHVCLSTEACATNELNMETSLGRRTTCNQAQPNSERFVINAIRYLWDVYDSRNEGQDLYSGNVNYLSETLFRYEEGYANHEEGEPWSCGICPVGGCGPCPLNDRDGRSAVDFKWNHKERWGFDSVGAYLQNCEPVGD